MFPLILSAWVIYRRRLMLFSPFLILYLAQLVIAHKSGNHTAMIWLIFSFETISTITFTLQGLFQPVEEFVLSLPVSRSQLVRSRYIFSLIGLVIGLGLPLLTASLAHLLFPAYVPALSREVLRIGCLVAIYLISGVFLFLPFVYQFGPEKGSTFFSLTLVLLVVGFLIWKGITDCFKTIMDFNLHFLESGTYALSVVAVVLVFGVASLLFSIWTYRKKVAVGGHPLSISKMKLPAASGGVSSGISP